MASRDGASCALVAMCLLMQLALPQAATTEPLVPAMFVFGDSTVDVGNNNYLKNCSIDCKADHPRYGVDYLDQAPTGRFSNGHNLADQLAQLLGFAESPPPFLSLREESRIPQMMSTGINFASGGSGILDGTGQHCGVVLRMSEQVGNFSSLVKSANQTAADLVSKSLFFTSVGSNDFFEYLGAKDPRNATEFLQHLVSSYSSNLKGLYAAGARKFSVVSPSLVGCVLSQRLIANQTNDLDRFNCLAPANNLSYLLYPKIVSMLDDLSTQLPGMNYSLGDSIRMAELVFNNTHTPDIGFTVLDSACCGEGDFGASACNVSVPLCKNRSSYLFFDRFHPTENASRFTATELFSDPGRFVHPINVQQLAASHP
ncbi:hypothetical protein QOZ80_4BG0338490 [Eleusine coracana subsp. coracana]|nr:hypothetical protein QOZ80_4BG0338490 [Eleusine coracana subsp. coracana]